MAKKSHPLQHPFNAAIAIAFIIVTGLILFVTLRGGAFELRSKAALAENVVKRWEFDGTTTEGWTASQFENLRVAKGLLLTDYGKTPGRKNVQCKDFQCQNRLYSRSSGLWMITNCGDAADPNGDDQLCNAAGRVGWCGTKIFCCPGPKQKWTNDMTACGGNKGPALINSSVSAKLPAGQKYAKIRLAVNDGKVYAQSQAAKLPQFTMTMAYAGKVTVNKPVQVTGPVDGQFHEYTLPIPDIGGIMINTVILSFGSLTPGTHIQMDWLRFISVVDIPPPTVSPSPTPRIPTPTPNAPTITPTPSPGIFSNAYNLDGTANYIKIAGSEDIHYGLGFTIESMFRPTRVPFQGYLFSKEDGSSVNFSLYMLAEPDPQGTPNTRFWFRWSVADSGMSCFARSIENQIMVPNDQALAWRHIAAEVQSDGSLQLFIDGKRTVNSSNAISGVCTSNLPIMLGARQLSPGDVGGYLAGLLDETRVTGAARYTADFVPPQMPLTHDIYDLVLYHQDSFFGDGYIKDYSEKGHDGVSYGPILFLPH
jgi:hypothetical protein